MHGDDDELTVLATLRQDLIARRAELTARGTETRPAADRNRRPRKDIETSHAQTGQMRAIIALVLGFAAPLLLMPAANADAPNTCRIGADGGAYSQTGSRCRDSDLNLWHTSSPQLLCWYTPSDPVCSGADRRQRP
jgi:hypothetical protein